MIVVGAGLSGLIASAMMRDQVVGIYDKQESLPNNHSALLRFKTSVVGDAVGIPFRKVKILKSQQPWKNPVADAIMYSKKATGGVRLRSSITATGEVEERYIAPVDLINQLGKMSEHKMHFKAGFDIALNDARNAELPLLSTIPMPTLMDLLGYENKPNFKFLEGFTINCKLPEEFDICATVYYPDPNISCYRASITERNLILEFNMIMHEETENLPLGEWAVVLIKEAIEGLGISQQIDIEYILSMGKAKRSMYNKIVPIDNEKRKRFFICRS